MKRGVNSHLLRCVCIVVFVTALVQPANAQAVEQLPPKTVVESVEGRKYEVMRISRKSADSITFTHSGGIVTFRANELTFESRQTLGMETSATPKQRPAVDLSKPLPNFSNPSTASACALCKGRKTILCTTCRGTGFGVDVHNASMCPPCAGKGTIRKPVLQTVNRGALKQNDSYISHYKDEMCAKCKGTGKLSSSARGYCSVCNGRQTIACTSCQ